MVLSDLSYLVLSVQSHIICSWEFSVAFYLQQFDEAVKLGSSDSLGGKELLSCSALSCVTILDFSEDSHLTSCLDNGLVCEIALTFWPSGSQCESD